MNWLLLFTLFALALVLAEAMRAPEKF